MNQERGRRRLKLLDRYIGIPLVALLGVLLALRRWFRPRPATVVDSRGLGSGPTIGILATCAIGDTVIASGIIRDLRAAWPAARIVMFTTAATAPVASLIPAIDDHVQLCILRPWKALATLRRQPLDWLIDIGPWPRINALLSGLSRSTATIGFKTPGQYRHYVYDHVVALRYDCHQLVNYGALLQPFGVPSGHPPAVVFDEVVSALVAPRPYAVFHAWPGGYKAELKQWPVLRWVALAQRVHALGISIVLTGADADVEDTAMLAAAIRAGGVPVDNRAGVCALAQTVSLLKRAAVVVSVDTGVLHLAAAVGVPVVGLHGPSSSLRWGGIGPQVFSIDAIGSDCGYLNLGFEHPAQPPDCMSRIGVGRVYAAVVQLLDQPLARPAERVAGRVLRWERQG
ncbi:MAG: glycosyltransferase family 9 protein [Nevskia sp.]|nr:glycosyltransferase family 9 protein [Nevskia sp.]